MYAFAVILLSVVVGNAYGEAPYNYNPQRQAPYNVGPNDPYTPRANYISEPSQRLFWSQGSNSVGGPGIWTSLKEKFPILGQMFGRIELPTEYGVPVPNSQYVVPPQQYYQTPQFFQPQSYLLPQYQQPQTYQQPQFFSQQFPVFRQRFPGARDVGFTDDAVIVTPPQVPIAPQPAPLPQPAPVPQPTPAPASDGYHYNKPQYRLDLPHK